MKKIDRLLAKTLAASMILFLVSLVFSKNEKSAQKSVQSAILNQKYKDEVAEIEISESGGTEKADTITLRKQGEFWLFAKKDESTKTEIRALADPKIINSLIENAVKIRKMYTISDKVADYDSLGLGEENGTTISFLKNDGMSFTKVYFGYADSLKNRIFIRSEHSKTAYECENDFQQYLTAKTNYWSEGEILSEIRNPVQITLRLNESSEVSAQKTLVLDEKSPEFASKAHALLSLRHGAVLGEDTVAKAAKIAELTVQDGNGRVARIDFFEKNAETAADISDSEEISYFYTKSVRASEIDLQETKFALYSESAAYEISSWTFERIKGLF